MAYRVMTEQYGNPSSTHARGREAKKLLATPRAGSSPSASAASRRSSPSPPAAPRRTTGPCSPAPAPPPPGADTSSAPWPSTTPCANRSTSWSAGATRSRALPPDPERRGAGAGGAGRAQAGHGARLPHAREQRDRGGERHPRPCPRAQEGGPRRSLLHCDAVQGFLKVPFTVKSLGADMVTISGHKIHAPKGIGALYIRSGLHLRPLIRRRLPGGRTPGRHGGHAGHLRLRRGRARGPRANGRVHGAHGRAAGSVHVCSGSAGREPGPRRHRRRRAAHPVRLPARLQERGAHERPGVPGHKRIQKLRLQKGRAEPRAGGHGPARARSSTARCASAFRAITTAEELDAFCLCLREARETLAHA